MRVLFRRARARGHFKRPVVVIGTNAEALSVVNMLQHSPELGYEVVGLLDCDTAYGVVPPVPVLGRWSDAIEIMQEVDATGVIVAASAMDVPLANRLARELMERGYHVELTSGLVDISASRLIARPLGRRPVIHVEPVRRFGWRGVAKRAFDIAIAATGLIIVSPILLAAAILIKFDSKGSVFFRQERVGKNGKPFGVLKLRTMQRDAEQMLPALLSQSDADGPLFKMRKDPRVTRVGRVLRKWSIDELPQLWNVLRGEMSIVGPRPGAAGRDLRMVRGVAEPLARQTGHHGDVAGQLAERGVVRGLRTLRPVLRRQLVAAHRPRDHRQDDSGCALAPRRVLRAEQA